VEWRKGDGPDDLADWSLDQMARFGLAVFVEFARQAVAERLPMLLDYKQPRSGLRCTFSARVGAHTV